MSKTEMEDLRIEVRMQLELLCLPRTVEDVADVPLHVLDITSPYVDGDVSEGS